MLTVAVEPNLDWWFKVARAQHHLDELKAEFRRWVNADGVAPFTIVKELDRQADRGTFTFRIGAMKPGPEWGLLLGDAVQNLRDSLDHLAWYLVSIGSSHGTLTDSELRRVAFPIAPYAGWYTPQRLTTFLPGVHPDFIKVVDSVQPHIQGSGFTLGWLSHLSNENKHRTIPTTVTQSFQKEVGHHAAWQRDFDVDAIQVCAVPGFRVIGPQTRIAEATGIIKGLDPDVQMEFEFSISIAFENGRWIEQDFLMMFGTVVSVLNRCQELLPAWRTNKPLLVQRLTDLMRRPMIERTARDGLDAASPMVAEVTVRA
jgi:hypothetical protein